MERKKPIELIIDTLKEKACLKQRVYKDTFAVFKELKQTLSKLASQLSEEMADYDDSVVVEYIDRGEFDCRLKLGGDMLVFLMHTNIFEFDKNHSIWNMSYVKEDELRSYCGMINVYNFLADSFKYNRTNDVGYLIARTFINKDKHFYLEGKRQLGFLYNSFDRPIKSEDIRSIVESSILYSMDFDLLAPPYPTVQEISVNEVLEVGQMNRIKTGKRLGFKFEADNTEIG